MTAYEYWDVAYSGWAAAQNLVSIAIAVMSGYVVIAYTVGSNLTKLQVGVLNITYAIIMTYTFFSGYSFMTGAGENFAAAMKLLQGNRPLPPFVAEAFIGMGVVMLVASLWFMWNVRHGKRE